MTQTTNTFWTFTIPDIGLGPRFMKMAKTHSRLVAADCLRRNKVSDINMVLNGLPWWLSSKESACDAEDAGDVSSSKGDIHRGLWGFMESSAPFHTREQCGGGRRILFKLHVGRWVKTSWVKRGKRERGFSRKRGNKQAQRLEMKESLTIARSCKRGQQNKMMRWKERWVRESSRHETGTSGGLF